MTLQIVRLFGPKIATRSGQERLELTDDSLQALRSGKKGEIGTGKPFLYNILVLSVQMCLLDGKLRQAVIFRKMTVGEDQISKFSKKEREEIG